MFIALVLLLLVAAVVAVPLVLLARKRRAGQGNSAAEIVSYLILVVATLLATNAFASLVESILPGDGVLFSAPDDLALTLSTLIVSGAVWASVWSAFERRRGGAVSTGRGVYLSISLAVAITVVAASVVELLAFIFGLDGYEAGAVARLLTFGALWGLLERWRTPADPADEIRQLWGSVLGLGLSTSAVAFAVHGSLETLFEGQSVLLGEDALSIDLRWAAALALVGVPLFIYFWLRRFAPHQTGLRDLYAGVVAVVGWITAAGTITGLSYYIIARAIGMLSDNEGLAVLLTSFLIGAVAYWHHRGVMGAERREAVKAVEYFLGGASLIGFAGSLVFLIGLIVSGLGEVTLIGDGEAFLAGVVSVLVGGALTIVYWGRLVGRDESSSPSRRGTLMILFFGSAITAAVALITVLFVLLRAALSGGDSFDIDPLAYGLPALLVAGAVCWHVVRLRRQLTPVPAAETPATATVPVTASTDRVVTVVAADPGPLPAMIEKMRFLRRQDGVGTVDAVRAEAIVSAINQSEARAVLVTVEGDDFSLIPLA